LAEVRIADADFIEAITNTVDLFVFIDINFGQANQLSPVFIIKLKKRDKRKSGVKGFGFFRAQKVRDHFGVQVASAVETFIEAKGPINNQKAEDHIAGKFEPFQHFLLLCLLPSVGWILMRT
jgi:hypothetical protein